MEPHLGRNGHPARWARTAAQAVILPLILAGSWARPAAAQVVVPDRRIEGVVRFTNTLLSPPNLGLGTMDGRSIGLDNPLNSTGPVFGGTPPDRDYGVVVNAYEDGRYWLTAVVPVGPTGRYRFGYARSEFLAPGWPNFPGDVWRPLTVDVPPSAPPLITQDVAECAGRFRIRFVEDDGLGEFRPAAPGSWVPGSERATARPRRDPAASAAPYQFNSGDITLTVPAGVQAEATLQPTLPATDLWVRASMQSGGPDVLYSVHVAWRRACDPNPDCPAARYYRYQAMYFEGATGSFGSLGSGGVASSPGTRPGIRIGCDETIDLFVVVPPPCPPEPCPPGSGSGGGGGGTSILVEGCLNLIGESERTSRVEATFSSSVDNVIENLGGSPLPYSELFDHFDRRQAEGIYGVWSPRARAPSVDAYLEIGRRYDTTGTFPRIDLHPPRATGAAWPSGGAPQPGPDLCMVPGIFTGNITLRDGRGRPSGLLRDLSVSSTIIATTADSQGMTWRPSARGMAYGDARRDFFGGTYDPASGVRTIPYENPFGNPNNEPFTWHQRRLRTEFNSRANPAEGVQGSCRVEFVQPSYGVPWTPEDFISTDLGGRWDPALGLMAETGIAPREARLIPMDYDLCYGTLRIQVDTQNYTLFDPRVTALRGHHVRDPGTPADPTDDLVYDVVADTTWLGVPVGPSARAQRGYVTLRLPEGTYTNLAGDYRTYFGSGIPAGVTPLPHFDVMPLACGQTCTMTDDAIACLEAVQACNDPEVIATDTATLRGTLKHEAGIVSGYTRVDGGSATAFDIVAAGVTCGVDCVDDFVITVSGFHPCRNRIEVGFEDSTGRTLASFLFTNIDRSPPVFHQTTSPTSPLFSCGTEVILQTVGCVGERVATWFLTLPQAIDDCSSPSDASSRLTVTSDKPSSAVVGETTVVHLTATDACGNVATCDVPYTFLADTTPPTLVGVPPDRIITCTETPSWPAVTATNEAYGAAVMLTDVIEAGDCPDERVHVRTWTSTDRCGNVASATRRIAVVDLDAPTMAGIPADATVECDAIPPPPRVTAADACDPAPAIKLDETLTPGPCPDEGTLRREWTATDRCGNSATRGQVLTIVDTTPPELSGRPEDVMADCAAVPLPATLTARDACDPDPSVAFAQTRRDGRCAGDYVLTRRWVAADRCGNEMEWRQTVTVTDTTAPMITPSDSDLACTWPPNHRYICFGKADFAPSITDDCSEPVTWRFAGCRSDQCDEAPCAEHPGENGDGHFTEDCVISPDGQGLCVRSERAGAGAAAQAGRRYGIAIVATDACGNESAPVEMGKIHVPLDQSPHERPCRNAAHDGCASPCWH